MILFRNVRIVEFDPPSVSELTDVAIYEPGEGEMAGTVAAIGSRLHERFPSPRSLETVGISLQGLSVPTHTSTLPWREVCWSI